MRPMTIKPGIHSVGAVHWNRRLFDEIIPLPDGTTYNSYLIQGSARTALIDTVDTSQIPVLMNNLGRMGVEKIDYVIANHAEQDHAGAIPQVMSKYPAAKLVCTPKCRDFLIDLGLASENQFITVTDRQNLSLGDKTLEFIYFPWVHWPETMLTYLKEDRILFPCDLFGSHLATTDLFVTDEGQAYEAAKRYYAEIMMPFRTNINRDIGKLDAYNIEIIACSHGPVYSRPRFIIDAYKDWISETPRNMVVLPYVSMHGSTRKMVEHLVDALAERGVPVTEFDLVVTDIGKLAMALVDAATVVIGTPYMLAGLHPLAAYATYLFNLLRPKTRQVGIIGSYNWGGRPAEIIKGMITGIKPEILPPVLAKGYPKTADFEALDNLASQIAERHQGLSGPRTLSYKS